MDMNGRKAIISIVSLMILLNTSLEAQNLNYSVMWKGDSIGIVSANKYDSAEFKVYAIKSRVEFWFLGIKTINYDYITIYKQDTLISAHTRYTRNGDTKAESFVRLHDTGYSIIVDGDSRMISNPHPIVHSVTAIYHNEPHLLTGIFSERFGEILKVNSPDPNHYFIEKPDGRQTEYYFENGICSKVVIDNFFTTFTFERSH